MTRALRLALGAVAATSIVAAAAAAAFLAGVELDGHLLRPRLEGALTAVFGMPTRIEGPLRLRTGRTSVLSADALVVSDPASGGGDFARGIRPAVRIDLAALLLRQVVDLEEVSGERLELTLRRGDDGRPNWAPMFTASPRGESPVSFAGIGRLRLDRVTGSYGRDSAPPTPFAIDAFAGGWRPRGALAASGTLQVADEQIGFDLRKEPPAGGPPDGDPRLRGTIDWSGVRIRLDGRIAGGTRFAGRFSATAPDATAPLAALGVAARDPGPFTADGQLELAATEATARDVTVAVGASRVDGSAGANWSGPQPTVAVDLSGERIDVAPFAGDASPRDFAASTEALLGALERLATAVDADVRLAAQELGGAPLAVRRLHLEARSGNGAFNARAAAEVAGTPMDATLAYDASMPRRKIDLRIDSGAVPAAALRREADRQGVVDSIAGVRGRLRGEGENPRAMVASLAGELDARGVDWSLERPGSPTLRGRFDNLRVGVQGARASSAEVSGRIEGAACRLSVTGGGLAPLLAGESWPLRMSATCPGERGAANGSIGIGRGLDSADLTFDFTADRRGPAARALGVPASLPHPITAQGRLTLDAQRAVVRIGTLRLGRTAGTAEIEVPRDASAPRLRLTLATLDLDGIAAAGGGGSDPSGAAEPAVLRGLAALPDADFDVTAAQVDAGGIRLRDFSLGGSVRAQALRSAPFRFEWQRTTLSGRLDVDAGRAVPRLRLDGTAENADFDTLLAKLGTGGIRFRARTLAFEASAQGERLADLLSTAELAATATGGQIDLGQNGVPGLSGRGTLSATLEARPGRPAKLAARGEIDGRPIDIVVEAPAIEALVRPETSSPVSLRATLADLRLDAEGRIAAGAGEARVQLSGAELDRLGALLGIALPATGPYSASAEVALSGRSVAVSSLQASVGRSRLAGSLRGEFPPGRRPLVEATLRAPVLHLEDLFGRRATSGDRSAAPEAPESSIFGRLVNAIDPRLDVLRAADARLTLDVDALMASGETLGGGRVRATLAAARLSVLLQEVRAQQGRIDAALDVDASAAQPRFDLRTDVRGFRYGPLLQLFDATSSHDGSVDLIVALTLPGRARELEALLAGTVDVAIYPRGVRSAALGLLGTSVVPAILRQFDPKAESAIECSVTGLSIADGVARSDGFFIMTTHARLIGDLEARLATRAISGRFVPRSRTPQLFTLSPTLVVGGTLENPTVSSAPENLLLVPLRFASPISLFATDWLSGRRATDGTTACREAFERIHEAQSQAQAAAGRP